MFGSIRCGLVFRHQAQKIVLSPYQFESKRKTERINKRKGERWTHERKKAHNKKAGSSRQQDKDRREIKYNENRK